MFFRADYLHPKGLDREEVCREEYFSEEIFERLNLVRKKLSKIQHIPEADVLSDEIIKILAMELPDFYPGVSEEFLHEISHYKKMNTIDDLEFSLDFNQLDPDLIESYSLKKKSNSEHFSKKIKK